MTLEDQIAALLLEAAPLRCLPEFEQGELGAIVDRINALRALQAAEPPKMTMLDVIPLIADTPAQEAALIAGHKYLRSEAKIHLALAAEAFGGAEVKRGPGRPKKAAQ